MLPVQKLKTVEHFRSLGIESDTYRIPNDFEIECVALHHWFYQDSFYNQNLTIFILIRHIDIFMEKPPVYLEYI